jgi:hypothetical protein
MGRNTIRGQPRQKVSKTPTSTNKLGVVVYTCLPSYTVGINKGLAIQAMWRKTQDPTKKITKAGSHCLCLHLEVFSL